MKSIPESIPLGWFRFRFRFQ